MSSWYLQLRDLYKNRITDLDNKIDKKQQECDAIRILHKEPNTINQLYDVESCNHDLLKLFQSREKWHSALTDFDKSHSKND